MIAETHIYDALIIGSGAAGLNAADSLYENGCTNIAVLTEGLHVSTSLNTGSDKQTYYKLSTAGGTPDSVSDMAKTYFNCGGMQGYHALKEAALSLRCFFKLAEAGVPFPTNRYGEYVGYRTDHDVRARASSCGPLTSKYMCEALMRRVKHKKIAVFEPMRAVRLLVKNGAVRGVIALRADTAEFEVFAAHNVILALGGPAGLYQASVYPKCQTGGLGIALEAGAEAVSLCEWQYGLASTDFRWNLSGSYQQVIPRYISVDNDGNVHEFLADYLPGNPCDLVFQKGYNWPFAAKNLSGENRSSLVDIAVYCESALKGRRVFLDFRNNPAGFSPDTLSTEARSYLENSGIANLPTPVERLKKLNEKAYRLYLDHGIDLEKVPLAADVCAQHCNGGLTVDENYMTNISGLYACGECAGVFGVTRPGGSALNSTQVSSLCAAMDIASVRRKADMSDFEADCAAQLAILEQEKQALYENPNGIPPLKVREEFAARMSRDGAFIRRKSSVEELNAYAHRLYASLAERTSAKTPYDIYCAFVNRDLAETMLALICSMEGFAKRIGKSRGGFLVCGGENDLLWEAQHAEIYGNNQEVITAVRQNGTYVYGKQTVSPIPESDQWFEHALSASVRPRWEQDS